MKNLKFAFLSGAILGAGLLLSPVAGYAGSHVGVTAAVNKNATGKLPSGRVRTVVMGNRVVFKERINTSGTGLVQILFIDGSTVTVGANASLVIDQFVYNPKKGTGKLVVSFGKGVMRFVGGKLSKKKGGVTIRTTVGTAGIRGGMANIAINGGTGIFSFLYGDDLIFTGRGGQRRRIYQAGYTLLAERQGSTGYSRLVIRRTENGDTEFFQQRLAGNANQQGGARRRPSNSSVATGPLPPHNSLVPGHEPRGNPQTVEATPQEEIEDGLIDMSNAFDDDPMAGSVTPYCLTIPTPSACL